MCSGGAACGGSGNFVGAVGGCSQGAGSIREGHGRRQTEDDPILGKRLVVEIGQTYGLAEDWPHYEVADYTRAIDYDAKWSREDYTRRQGKYPTARAGLPMPEEHVTSILSGNYAWDMKGDTPVPLTRPVSRWRVLSDLRQLEIVLTPHGFLKAALAAKDAKAIELPIVGASDFGLSQFGRKVTVVSFTMGKYRVNGTINDQNLVELTDTWFPNPVYGDMDYEMRYTKYKNFDGVMFPHAAARAPGRSAAESGAQLLRVQRHGCEDQRAGDADAGAGSGADGQTRRR